MENKGGILNKRIAVVCASNQNRSVEAHALFMNKGFNQVASFGTSSTCKLPGPTIDKPNIYPFGTPYMKIHDELKRQNAELYKANGVLQMLKRNAKVKEFAERWQDSKQTFDLIFTFEDRVFDTVLDDLANREQETHEPVYIFNINTKDSHEEATIAASQALALIQLVL